MNGLPKKERKRLKHNKTYQYELCQNDATHNSTCLTNQTTCNFCNNCWNLDLLKIVQLISGVKLNFYYLHGFLPFLQDFLTCLYKDKYLKYI